MPVHDVAARGFDAQAAAYERGRPTYPADAVAWLVDALRIAPGATVADVAAGTGKLTRLLLPTGARVLAVEPVAGMRAALRGVLPGVPAVAAVAEALPFADGTLDAVTVAQAFHWFDLDAATAELARVLRPGGRLGLVWNERDGSDPWWQQVWSVMDEHETSAPWRRNHGDPAWREAAFADHDSFTPLTAATFRHVQRVDLDGLVDRFTSVSHVAALPPAEREAVGRRVRDLAAGRPELAGAAELDVPYRVAAYWTARR